MECPSEDITNVVQFWKLFQNAFKEANGNEALMNPTGYYTDMNSSCYEGIRTVFGEVITKGCEFHFKESVEKWCKSIQEIQREEFKSLAYELLCVSTSEAYDPAYSRIRNFINNSELDFLLSWLDW